MELKCPYCKSDLTEGHINCGRFGFRWFNKNLNFIEKYTVFGGELLCAYEKIKSYRCKNCNKIIIDFNERENI